MGHAGLERLLFVITGRSGRAREKRRETFAPAPASPQASDEGGGVSNSTGSPWKPRALCTKSAVGR